MECSESTMKGDTMDREEWMTVDEVAELFRVNAETVRRWIRAGDLPVLDLGGPKTGYRIRRSDVAAYAEARYGFLGKDAA
jgi:excisionase family DNA binding protein